MNICVICNEEISNPKKVGKCGHIICCSCICDHLKVLTSPMVTCPVQTCNGVISDFIVRSCLSNAQLEVYNTLCLGPDTFKCLIADCPNFVSYTENKGHFICDVCGQPNCITCGRLHSVDEHCKFVSNYDPSQYQQASEIRLRQHHKDSIVSLSNDNDLVPNPDSFVCQICNEFVIPRVGVMLRSCNHKFCKACLDGNFEFAENLPSLCCPLQNCSKASEERESRALIGNEKLMEFNLNIVKTRYYNCQTPDCKGTWDFSNFKADYRCTICHNLNCGACKDVHEGLTCEQFEESGRGKDAREFLRNYRETDHIICAACNTAIKKHGGCNALRCPTCTLQVCAYSGKEIGPNGCKCTNNRRCDPKCSPGCIPDGDTPYEKKLKAYFYDN